MEKVLLLFGGNSSEHKVSCLSAKSVLENIDRKMFDIISVGIDEKNDWHIFNDDLTYLEQATWKNAENITKVLDIVSFIKDFDIVFPIIHGTNGEDGKLQGFLDLFNIRYVGCQTLSSAVGMDKEFAKIIFKHLNIPQVPSITIKYSDYKINDIECALEYPLIVKPANGGSSIGISKVNNHSELVKAVTMAKNYDNKIVIEKFIKARELECAVIENNGIIVSTIGEIKSANEIYDYDAKYENNKSLAIIPADIPQEVQQIIKEYAKKAFIGINAKGISRIDFFYDIENKQIYLNEINTMPGFTTISMYPKLLVYDGIEYKDIITTLLNNA